MTISEIHVDSSSKKTTAVERFKHNTCMEAIDTPDSHL